MAELDWKIERDYDDETGLVNDVDDGVNQTYKVEKTIPQHSHEHFLEESEPRKSEIPMLTLRKTSDLTPVDYPTPTPPPVVEAPAPSKSASGTGHFTLDDSNKGAPLDTYKTSSPIRWSKHPSVQA